MGHSRLQYLRERLTKEGYNEGVFNLILQGYKNPTDKRGTLRTYQKTWEKFLAFCGGDAEKALRFSVKDAANFASSLFDEKASGSAVSSAITVLDATRGMVAPQLPSLTKDHVIQSIRRAAKKRRPSRKKSSQPEVYFDPLRIFKHLARIEKDTKLGVDKLRTKVATLLLLDGGLRGNELAKIFMENIEIEDKKIAIKFPWTKEERKTKWTHLHFYCSCIVQKSPSSGGVDKNEGQDLADAHLWRPSACSVCSLKRYVEHPTVIARRKKVPKVRYDSPLGEIEGSPLFITHKQKAKAIALKSMITQIKAVMKKAKIPPVWKVHDCRGATVSKLFNLGCDMRRCMKFGRWSSTKTLEDHYLKQAVYKESSEDNNKLPLWEVLRMKATLVDDC